jgi:hypothetical protein
LRANINARPQSRVVVENQLSQKQKRIGGMHTTLRAIHDFIDRHLTTKVVLAITVLLLVASWIYPPWIFGRGGHGWAFLFDTSHGTVRVDFGRLYLIDAIVATTGGLFAWTVSGDSAARRASVRLVFYALLVLPLIAVVCVGAVIVQEKFRLGSRKPDWFEQNAPRSRLSDQVAPDDLKKIILFDVVPKSGTDETSANHTWLTGFDGRVRNDLPRAVERIGLKASFYNPAGEVIEVRTFWMLGPDAESLLGPDEKSLPPLFPNSPITFHSRVAVNRLPYGGGYQLEVIEAHYVQP